MRFGVFEARCVFSHAGAHLGVNPPRFVVTSAAASSVPPTPARVTQERILRGDALGNAESTVLLVPAPSVSPALLCAEQTLRPAGDALRGVGGPPRVPAARSWSSSVCAPPRWPRPRWPLPLLRARFAPKGITLVDQLPRGKKNQLCLKRFKDMCHNLNYRVDPSVWHQVLPWRRQFSFWKEALRSVATACFPTGSFVILCSPGEGPVL